MRFWGKRKKKAGAMPLPNPKQPATLKQAVGDAIKRQDGSFVKLFYIHPKTRTAGAVSGKINVNDARDMVEDMETYIRGAYGGGDWRVRIFKDDMEVAVYDFNVSGAPEYRTPGSGSERKESSGNSASNEMMMKMYETQAQMFATMLASKADPAETFVKFGEIMAAMQGNGDGDGFLKEMMTTMFNNALVDKTNSMDNLKSQIEVARMLQPQIPAEDSTTAIINALAAFAPSVVGMIASKQGGGNQVGNALNSLPPEKRQQIQQILEAPQASQGASLPQPGESSTQPQKKPVDTPGAQTGGQGGSVSISSDPRTALVDKMLMEFRYGLARGEDNALMAQELFSIVAYARGLGSPPEVLTGLLTASDIVGLAAGYEQFCAGTPELANNKNKADALKLALVATIPGQDVEPAQDVEVVTTEGVSPPESDIPQPAEPQEPEADTTDYSGEGEHDVRPSGISDPGVGIHRAEPERASVEDGGDVVRETANAA